MTSGPVPILGGAYDRPVGISPDPRAARAAAEPGAMMTARNRSTWRVLLPLIALVAAACGGAAASPSRSPLAAVPSVDDTSSAPPSGSFGPGPATLDLSTDYIVAMAAQENADRASAR